ncbi:LysR substrate-binding domain-containing protein [uncultured Paracoccus sp.]|uniref:LysR substrate-binding domain-containing protein n=1 Tax=uncultured Paracoccus sp. TaxID=189685 RepID=UPI0025D76D29|nr:LysR substrate-binding domain-containing protein [uncultured Paracoccus sp.]
MRWRQLQAFRETMAAGTMSGAAEIMGISQPAVSRHVEALEASLGIALFDRKSGRLVPTAEGRTFYEEVSTAFKSYERLSAAASDIKYGRKGRLHIACLPALGLGFMPGVIAEFARLRPDVQVHLDLLLTSSVEGRVSSQQIDIGVAEFIPDSFGAERETLLRTPYLMALPEGHALVAKQVLTPADLDAVPFVGFGQGTLARRHIESAFADAGAQLKIVCDTQYAAGICQLVRGGVGVGMVDAFTAHDFQGRGVLFRCFEPQLMFHVAVVYPKFRPLSRSASAFLKVLRNRSKGFRNEVQGICEV